MITKSFDAVGEGWEPPEPDALDRAEAVLQAAETTLATPRPAGEPWQAPESALRASPSVPYSPKSGLEVVGPNSTDLAVVPTPPAAPRTQSAFVTRAAHRAEMDTTVKAVGAWVGKQRREIEAQAAATDAAAQLRIATLEGRIATLEVLLTAALGAKARGR